MSKRPKDLIYAVNELPPLPNLILLGFQHACLIAIYLVLIVIVVRAAGESNAIALNAVSMGLIALAIATSLQAIWVGPIGSGFLAAPVVTAIYLEPSILAAKQAGLGTVFGMTIFAGLVEMVLSQFLHRLRVLFPPAISGLIVSVVGLQLGLVGVEQVLEIEAKSHPNFIWHMMTSVTTLAMMIGCSIWLKGIARLISSFLGIVAGFIVALFLGLIPSSDLTSLQKIHWVGLPDPSYISYHFSSLLVVPFLIGSIAASLRCIGSITSCQKINDSEWKHPDMKSIKGGVLADGIGCMLSGLLGSLGLNCAPSLIGVSQASGATSRYIAFAASIILFILAFLPKIIDLLLILPMSVIGAALVFTGSFMIVGGIQIMVSRNIDVRATYIIGIALLLGISREISPEYYASAPYILQLFTGSVLTISMTIAIILNLIFRLGIRTKAVMLLEKTEGSNSQLSAFISKQANAWGIFPDVITRSISTATEIMRHIQNAKLIKDIAKITLSYDQLDFVITISYQGECLSLPFVGQQHQSFLEEESFSYGLADFLIGVYPDKLSYSVQGKDVQIHLSFSV